LKQVFTHSPLRISVVVVVVVVVVVGVVVVEVGLIGTRGLFRLPEPSAPGLQFFCAELHLAEAPSRWLQGHQPPPSQPHTCAVSRIEEASCSQEHVTKSSKKNSSKSQEVPKRVPAFT
jgi:hypothetical protein